MTIETKIRNEVIAPRDIAKLNNDILIAANLAYQDLTQRGYDLNEVHGLQKCYDITYLMVKALTDNGYQTEHTISKTSITKEHSYATVFTDQNEIISDATWQQFLPKYIKNREDLPKVLTGTRDSVIKQALSYGVNKPTSDIWLKQSVITTDKKRREENQANKHDTEGIDAAWENIVANSIRDF